jgi:NAD(P)-dependent dehydrogenase (short-subunit alcohol dehydrogenase family)
VVAERTQYPVEMLALDQQIEADLGIDSIKRVEIITMLRESHPSLSDIADEKYYEEMAQLGTLGDVVAWIDKTFGGGPRKERQESELSKQHAPGDRNMTTFAEPSGDRQQVLARISEVTRYPVELIEMDLLFEEDLGMETAQLSEIMSKLIPSNARSSGKEPAQIRRSAQQLKSVQDLVQWVEQAGAVRAGEQRLRSVDTPEIPMEEKPAEAALFRRFVLELVEHSIDRANLNSLSGVLMLLDGGHPLGRQIQTEAAKQGLRCVRVIHHGDDPAENRDSIRFTPHQETDYDACYRKLKTSHGIPCGVLNLLCLGRDSYEQSRLALMESFLWAKTIGADEDLHQDNRWNFFWVSATGMGGDFGLTGAIDPQPAQNGLHGITKCLYHEWPGLQAKTIDIHTEENLEQLSRFVLDECRERHDTIQEIGFVDQTRHALALAERPHDSGTVAPGLNSESVLLITGGAKGITAEVAVALAQRYQPTMILVGRTPLPERSDDELAAWSERAILGAKDPQRLKSMIIKELKLSTDRVTPAMVNQRYRLIMDEYNIRQNIEKMKRFNAKVHYHACDCTNRRDFSNLIQQSYETFKKIDGVIHAAGCLKDASIVNKTTAHFKQVVDTKVSGARTLVQALDFDALQFIVFFSSVSGRFGNRGQADYAAANEILNKMAARLHHRWPGKAVAINWGPWEGEGMVSDPVKAQFRKAGVHLLPRDLGVQMLNRELIASDRAPEVVIFGADDIENRLPLVRLQMPPAEFKEALPFVQLFQAKAVTTGNSRCWELTLDQTAPYLNDHRIDSQAVLPAAVAMEIMAQAGLAAAPDYHFNGFQQFDLHKGITLASDHTVKLMVEVETRQNGSPDNLIASVLLTKPDQVNRSNYACRVLLGKAKSRPVPNPIRLHYSHVFGDSMEYVYENRLFHKGVFRALKRVESFEIAGRLHHGNGIKGIIEPSRPQSVIGDGIDGFWLIDPIVFDAAYQLALLWSQERYQMMALPSSIKQYRRYRPFNGGPIQCEIAVKETALPKIVMDFFFFDDDDRLCAKAIDVVSLISRGLTQGFSALQSRLTVHHS